MTDLFLVLLASVGLCHILVDGSVMLPFKSKLKEWDAVLGEDGKPVLDGYGEFLLKPEEEQRWAWLRKLLGCYQCSGWWAGLSVGGLWMLSFLPTASWGGLALFAVAASLKALLFAFAGSYASMLGAVLLIYFNTQQVSHDQDDGPSGDQAGSAK